MEQEQFRNGNTCPDIHAPSVGEQDRHLSKMSIIGSAINAAKSWIIRQMKTVYAVYVQRRENGRRKPERFKKDDIIFFAHVESEFNMFIRHENGIPKTIQALPNPHFHNNCLAITMHRGIIVKPISRTVNGHQDNMYLVKSVIDPNVCILVYEKHIAADIAEALTLSTNIKEGKIK